MTLTGSLTRPLVSSLTSTLLGGDESGPSISLSAPDFGGSTYYEGVDDDDITVSISNATDGASWDLTISSSGGGTPVTANGVVSGTTVNAGAQDLTGLNPGTLTFSYEEGSVEVASRTRMLATIAAPAAPVISIAPGASGSAQQTINWVAPSANGSAITGYTLTVDDGSGFSSLATLGAGDSSYVHSNLIIGKEYTYRLTATNGVGTSGNSNEPAETPAGVVHVFLLAGQSNMPGVEPYDNLGDYPSNCYDWTGDDYQLADSPLTGGNTGTMGLTITFVDDYLAANADVDAVALVQKGVGNTGFVTNDWSKGDTRYESAVTEVNQALSDYSVHTFAGILWNQGERDTNSGVTSGYQGLLEAMISDMRSDITGASASTPFVLGEIYEDNANDITMNGLINAIPTTTAYTAVAQNTGLTSNDNLHWNAASLRIYGQRYEDAFIDAVANVPRLAAAPTGLSATTGNLQIVLAWSAPADTGLQPITDYLVQYRAVGSGTWLTFTDVVSDSPGATVTGLSSGTDYEFQVAAVNASGTGPFSDPDNAVAGPLAPDQVGTITPTLGDGRVTLDWSAPADNGSSITDYIVQYKLSSSSTWLTFADGVSSTTGAAVTGLTNDSSYDFQVAAVNAVDTGPYSALVSETPSASGGSTFLDDFNRADENLDTDANWTQISGNSGGATVSSNRASIGNGVGDVPYRLTDFDEADCFVEAEIISGGDVSYPLSARLTDINNFLAARFTNSGIVSIASRVGGTWTGLATATPTFVSGAVLRLEVVGSEARVLYDGVEVIGWTDFSAQGVPASGRVGCIARFNAAVIDNYRAGPLS